MFGYFSGVLADARARVLRQFTRILVFVASLGLLGLLSERLLKLLKLALGNRLVDFLVVFIFVIFCN